MGRCDDPLWACDDAERYGTAKHQHQPQSREAEGGTLGSTVVAGAARRGRRSREVRPCTEAGRDQHQVRDPARGGREEESMDVTEAKGEIELERPIAILDADAEKVLLSVSLLDQHRMLCADLQQDDPLVNDSDNISTPHSGQGCASTPRHVLFAE